MHDFLILKATIINQDGNKFLTTETDDFHTKNGSDVLITVWLINVVTSRAAELISGPGRWFYTRVYAVVDMASGIRK